ncbi:MAG TPA: MFS transporter [Rhizomicrobium sp.]|nr:MFS transporter [Rhizomicrobium sp.]
MRDDSGPARFAWLPPGLRPPVAMAWRQEKIFLLVGVAALFAGYDMNVYGLATPQIQAGLHIPENQIAPTLSIFRTAAIVALLISASADLVGRRRLLLFTIFGQAVFTLLTAFSGDYLQFVGAQLLTRIFGYSEEMLCFVVIAEEMAAKARGWANGTLGALDYLGAGFASLAFLAVNILPFGWRGLYVVGAVPLFLVAFLRRNLPETRRFAAQEEIDKARSKTSEGLILLRELVHQHPWRLLVMMIAAAGFGFATAPAAFLSSDYLQSVIHYTPLQVNLVFIPGGLVGLALAIRAGRLSDRLGRKITTAAVAGCGGLSFALFYSGITGWYLGPLWSLAFFGFLCGDALIAGFAIEIVPTRYRATVSGLRYLVSIAAGALSLLLEGRLYDRFHAHAPSVQLLLCTIPLTMLAVLFLPEPAGKSLEEIA